MKKRTSFFSQDPHPKPEITDAFDLFLNTDLCWVCVSLSRQWDRKKKKNEAISWTRNLITLPLQCLPRWMKQCTSTKNVQYLSAWDACSDPFMQKTRTQTHRLFNLSKDSIIFLCWEQLGTYWTGAAWKRSGVCLCEWLSVADWNDITGYSVFIYPYWSACYNSPDECLREKIESNWVWRNMVSDSCRRLNRCSAPSTHKPPVQWL